jgi:hypothetical protein
MPPLHKLQHAARIHLRPHPPAQRRQMRKACASRSISAPCRAVSRTRPPRPAAAAAAPQKSCARSRPTAPARSESSSRLLQLRRRKPLRIHQRLLALIVRRHRLRIRLRHLKVVPEDRIEPHLQRSNPVRARSRSSIAAMCCRPLVESPRSSSSSASTPCAHCAAIAQRYTGGSSTSVRAIISRRSSSVSSFSASHFHRQAPLANSAPHAFKTPGSRSQRYAQRNHLARPRRIQRHASQQPLQVEHAIHRPAQVLALAQVTPLRPPHPAAP